MILLKNGKIITEDGILQDMSLVVEGDYIKEIIPNASIVQEDYDEIIDCIDKYIAPGLIDIHSDYIESIVSPRPSVLMDFEFALRETERILINSGITTMYHSLSCYPDSEATKSIIRKPENNMRLINAINNLDDTPHIIRNRVHLRFELTSMKMKDEVMDLMRDGKIHHLSFMDHTPGQGQFHNFEVYRDYLKGYNPDKSEEEIEQMVEKRLAMETLKLEEVEEMADLAKKLGITLASHDDDSLAKLDMNEKLGIKVSEFPTTIEVAKEARARGMETIAGSPNLLLGKSQSGNMSAENGLEYGGISVIASDYYPQSMLASIFRMYKDKGMALNEMFNLATINPAKAVGIDHMYGSIEPGKKADILVIEEYSAIPIIKIAMVDGHIVFRTSYRYDK